MLMAANLCRLKGMIVSSMPWVGAGKGADAVHDITTVQTLVLTRPWYKARGCRKQHESEGRMDSRDIGTSSGVHRHRAVGQSPLRAI